MAQPEYSQTPGTAMDGYQTINPVFLVSSKTGFAGQLLPNLISKDLNCACHQSPPNENLPCPVELVVIDCRDLEVEDVSTWLQSNLEYCHSVALVHMPHHPNFERFMEWPKVNGIFYEGTRENTVLQGIRRMLCGELWLPRRLLTNHLENSRINHPMQANINLTRRENQIMSLMKSGASNADISENLGLSENTVKSHLYKIYKKIGATNRMDAANWARMNVE